ncbi:MAG: hypothetical protein E6I26_06950 [Chloroflexi bacterium]|nr:MAG: hypothetical protein E6I26_06950 [Chloroflexota bacterium]
MRPRFARAVGLSGVAGLCLAAALAAPVAANSQLRFTIDDTSVLTHSCGVVETTRIYGRGTASFDVDGTWVGTAIHLTYTGIFTDPATGRTITQVDHQNVTEADGVITMRGQGAFIRLGGEGVLLHDVGRLVFDPSDGSTVSATPKVLTFDDPDAAAKVEAAVCSMFD